MKREQIKQNVTHLRVKGQGGGYVSFNLLYALPLNYSASAHVTHHTPNSRIMMKIEKKFVLILDRNDNLEKLKNIISNN